MPTQDCGVVIKDLIVKLNQSETYLLVEDSTMSPAMSKASATPPAVKQCAWSPIISVHRMRCLLAVLTNKGALEIHAQWRNTSVRGVVISDKWYDYCCSHWESYPADARAILAELKARSYMLKFTAFVWGKYIINRCDFFVCTLDGTITLWKINIDLETRNTDAVLISDYKTGREHITCITCHYLSNKNYLLFVAYIDGTIKSFKSSDDGENIIQENDLWKEADKLQVPAGGLICDKLDRGTESSELVLYAIKGNIVLTLYVDLNGKLISLAETPFILNDLIISGFTPWTDNQFLIITNSGNVFILSQNHKEVTLSKVQDSVIRANHYSCYGICRSKNTAIIVLATSIRCNYDHLVVKDTGHMVWYSRHISSEITTLLSDNSGSLTSNPLWDLLEIYRIDCIFNSTEIPWNYSSEDIDKLEIIDLKKKLALLQLSILIDSIRNENCEQKIEKEVEIKELILSCHIFKTILCLINEHKLDELSMKSLMIMKKWLSYLLDKYSSKYNHTATTAVSLQEQLNKFCISEEEECLLCSSEVLGFTRSDLAECQRGHQIPRCSLSLLQCMDVPYYMCRRCNVIAHPSIVTEKNNCCLYCDYPFRISELILRDDEMNPVKLEQVEDMKLHE